MASARVDTLRISSGDVRELANAYESSLFKGIAELVLEKEEGMLVTLPLQPDVVDAARLRAVVRYLLRPRELSLDERAMLANGSCTPEIKFMGVDVDKWFVGDVVTLRLFPASDKFTEGLRVISDEMWRDDMRIRYDRCNVYNSIERAVRQGNTGLTELTRESLARLEPISLARHGGDDVPYGIVREEKYTGPDEFVTKLDFPRLGAYVDELKNKTLAGLPWLADGGTEGIVVAGEALETALIDTRSDPTIEIYMVCSRPHQAIEVGRRLLQRTIMALASRPTTTSVRISEREMDPDMSEPCWMCIDTTTTTGTRAVRCRVNPLVHCSLTQLLVTRFDIGSSRIVYDGRTIWAHDTAMRAWRNGWNVFDVTSCAFTDSRKALYGHARRSSGTRGMQTLVVGMTQAALNDRIRECDDVISQFADFWQSGFSVSKLMLIQHFSERYDHVENTPEWAIKLKRIFGRIQVDGARPMHVQDRTVDSLLMVNAACELGSATTAECSAIREAIPDATIFKEEGVTPRIDDEDDFVAFDPAVVFGQDSALEFEAAALARCKMHKMMGDVRPHEIESACTATHYRYYQYSLAYETGF